MQSNRKGTTELLYEFTQIKDNRTVSSQIKRTSLCISKPKALILSQRKSTITRPVELRGLHQTQQQNSLLPIEPNDTMRATT